MAESKWTEARPGDRFEYGHRKITIMDVDGDQVDYAQLDETDKTIWSLSTVLPLPSDWVRVGRGPEPKRKIKVKICGSCAKRPAEPGQVYCWDCLTKAAPTWAALTSDAARAATKLLATRMTEEERDDDGDRDGDGDEASPEAEDGGGEGE